MKKIITEFNKCNHIPFILFCEEGTTKLPLVIIGHGFNNDKFEGANYALKLANEGFAALCFDMAKQGDRYDGFMESITCDVDFGNVLFNIIKESNDDLNKLIAYFENDERIDSERIAISGLSHGANLCYYAMSKNERLKAAVPILGSPDFSKLIVYSMERESESDFIGEKEEALLSFIKVLDPREHLVNKEERPMLLINALKDEDIPHQMATDYYNAVKDRYSRLSSSIELFIADEFHYVSKEMITKSIDWLKNNL